MIRFLFVILLCVLAGCSEHSSGFDIIDARTKNPVSQPLNVDSFSVNIQYYREDACPSVTFEQDSMALECLDSAFNVVSRITDYYMERSTATFKDLELQSPFVEIVQYGHLVWKYDVQTYRVYVELRNLKNAVNMDTVKFDYFTDVLIKGRLRRYLEEGIPFYVAEGMAKKDFNQFLKSKNLSASFVFCNVSYYPETENVQRHFDKFQHEFTFDTLSKDSPVLITLDSMLAADSVISDCNIDYLALVYDFNQCSHSNYIDSIMNPFSKWYGTVLYCDSSMWRIIPKDSLPSVCTMYNKDELRLTKDSTFVACDGNGSWRDTKFEEPYLTQILGKCDSNETSIDTLGQSVLCASDGKWHVYRSELERQIGICGITAKYDSIAEHENVFYFCTETRADNQEEPGVWEAIDDVELVKMELAIGKCCSTTPCGTLAAYRDSVYYCDDREKKWREANSRELALFTDSMGGNCNRNSSHIQVVNVSGEGYWMCVDSPVDGINYGWTRLNTKYHKDLTTYFNVESDESTKVVAVDLSTDFFDYNYVLYLNGDRSDSSLYGVVYPKGFYKVIVTEDLLMLDRPIDGVSAADENCPIGFHVEDSICVKSRAN